MENNSAQKDINELINEIDVKIEEIKNDPSYNEEEGKKQVQEMYDYIKEHPQATEEALKSLKDKIGE